MQPHDRQICNQEDISFETLQLRLHQAQLKDNAIDTIVEEHLNKLKLPEIANSMLPPLEKPEDCSEFVMVVVDAINRRMHNSIMELFNTKQVLSECIKLIVQHSQDLKYARENCTCGAFKHGLRRSKKEIEKKVKKRIQKALTKKIPNIPPKRIPKKRQDDAEENRPERKTEEAKKPELERKKEDPKKPEAGRKKDEPKKAELERKKEDMKKPEAGRKKDEVKTPKPGKKRQASSMSKKDSTPVKKRKKTKKDDSPIVQDSYTKLDDDRYRCNTCSRIITSYPNIFQHWNIHNLKKKFPCDLCGATLSRKYDVKIHKQKYCPFREK